MRYDDDTPLDGVVPSKSKYLAKEDVGEEGMNVTIAGFSQEEVKGDDGTELCPVLHFEEDVKPLILNKTNKNRIKHITKAETAGQARGKKINVFNDPMVEFGGRLTGGVRIRPATVAGMSQSVPDMDDDIPY